VIPVIDMWAPIVPSREIIAHAIDHFPEPQLSYLEIFQGAGATAESWRTICREIVADDDAILAALDAAGIRKTLITGFDETTSSGDSFVSNESVAAIAGRHPDRFVPFAGVDVFRGAEAVRELETWIERGFRGLSLRPFMTGIPADDPRYDPFYEACVRLGVPVSMHASANWTRSRPSDLGHPRHFDAVACRFPELRLILSHAGYPWVLEACLLAWKHPNVYLELAAHRPRYFTAPGAGWEPLLRFGQSTIQDKILYGTGAFLIARPPGELVQEMKGLPIRREVLEKWLWRNAARLLGIPESEVSAQPTALRGR
jgi:predicted TIM-barrel fold metal-dependent hydrolase